MSNRKKETVERTDREKLELFVEEYNELTKTPLAQKGIRPNFGYTVSIFTALDMGIAEPDEDELRSFLMALRPFISKEEPIFLNHIYNICFQRLVEDELKKLLAGQRDIWKKVQAISGIKLVIEEKEISGLEAWNIWINGKYFHKDLRYQQILKQADQQVLTLYRVNFLDFVGQSTQCVRNLASFILKGLDENKFNLEL